MDELTETEIETLKRALLELKIEVEQMLVAGKETTKPVSLDQPIGRLTRIDAIQMQKMAEATAFRNQIRIQQINAAILAIRRDDYGYCNRCEEPIGWERLSARPEAPVCLTCQVALEAN